MRFNHLLLGAALGVSTLLTGCGGDSSSASGSSASSGASEKLTVRQKTTAADYNNAVQELYIAYFGRPADPSGLANIEATLLAANAPTDLPGLSVAYSTNATVKAVIDGFGYSSESLTLYGSGTAATFVTAVFKNVFGRAPATAGLTYWSNAIQNQGLSMPDAAVSIMAGALQNNTAAGLVDAQTILNKVAVASSFTTTLGANTSNYKGAAAAYAARVMLSEVTSTTTASGFQSNVTATIATIAAANKTNLTLSATTSASPGTAVGQFNESLASCQAGTTNCAPITTATCMYDSAVGVAPFVSSVVNAQYADISGRYLNIYIVHDSGPFTVGEQPNNQGFNVTSTSFQDASISLQQGSWYSRSASTGTVTVTAVGTNSLTLTYNNYSLINISTLGNLTLNGTVEISCEPPSAS
jgi:hypothetical protein